MTQHLGDKLVLTLKISGFQIELDIITMFMSWVTMAIIIAFAVWLRRGLTGEAESEPTGREVILESIIEFFEGQILSGFESRTLRRRLFSFLSTLFLFILVSNWLSAIPGLSSPTQDLNIPFSFAILIFLMSHYYGMKMNGPGSYLKSFLEPYPFMAPLTLISELAKPLSHSFRLFGNVFGGAVLVAVVSSTIIPYVLPALLQIFYGLFIGAIHAFVFVLLAVAYINVAVE